MSNELDFLVNDANTTDQDTVRIAGKTYPWVQWIYGERDYRKLDNILYHGGFFLPKVNLDVTGNPLWTPETIEHENSRDPKKPIVIPGFWAKSLPVAFINERHRYELSPGDGAGKLYLYAATDYDAAEKLMGELNRSISDPRKQYRTNKKSQFLVCVKGMEDHPIILTLRNTAARRVSGQTGLKQAFDRTVMAFVNAELIKAGTTNKLPMRRFWVEVGASVDASGDPDFQEVGKGAFAKYLTVPSMRGVPQALTMDYVKGVHTGAANKERFDALYRETLDWSQSWSSIKAGSSPEAVEATESVPPITVDPETAKAIMAL